MFRSQSAHINSPVYLQPHNLRHLIQVLVRATTTEFMLRLLVSLELSSSPYFAHP